MTKWSYPGRLVSRLRLSLGDQVNLNLSPNMLYISENLGPKGQASADQVAGRFISNPLTFGLMVPCLESHVLSPMSLVSNMMFFISADFHPRHPALVWMMPA